MSRLEGLVGLIGREPTQRRLCHVWLMVDRCNASCNSGLVARAS